MIEKIKDILERHYYGRNVLEDRCSKELLDLFLVSKPLINELGNLKSLVSIIENGAVSETIGDTLKESRAIIEKLDNVSKPFITEWVDIKKDKPKEADEFIITYLDYKKEKGAGSAWWNGETFEDWGEEPNVIKDVIGWMELPTAM